MSITSGLGAIDSLEAIMSVTGLGGLGMSLGGAIFGAYDMAMGIKDLEEGAHIMASDQLRNEAKNLRERVPGMYRWLSVFTHNHEALRRENEIESLTENDDDFPHFNFNDNSWREMKKIVHGKKHYYRSKVYGNLARITSPESGLDSNAVNNNP